MGQPGTGCGRRRPAGRPRAQVWPAAGCLFVSAGCRRMPCPSEADKRLLGVQTPHACWDTTALVCYVQTSAAAYQQLPQQTCYIKTVMSCPARRRFKILCAGGDGTVAWILGTIHKLDLQPIPQVSACAA